MMKFLTMQFSPISSSFISLSTNISFSIPFLYTHNATDQGAHPKTISNTSVLEYWLWESPWVISAKLISIFFLGLPFAFYTLKSIYQSPSTHLLCLSEKMYSYMFRLIGGHLEVIKVHKSKIRIETVWLVTVKLLSLDFFLIFEFPCITSL